MTLRTEIRLRLAAMAVAVTLLSLAVGAMFAGCRWGWESCAEACGPRGFTFVNDDADVRCVCGPPPPPCAGRDGGAP